ncbi:UdgX family uracil-DNA binding protein [Chelatococcus sambhunathii]|uniref:Type-4 uracil-DNA glycosylase n=1 Tax=Chelatococcus sambhunathii TaxID=363953 RepID=A0ABU1DBH1_9HYPH|nr:UdgX family uracil-DNA binding protein [Chelatococcus sambhunathii]MDR4305454.1 UdgX family uracil-DNA binding protein [Chelatococcus sambhunathii]
MTPRRVVLAGPADVAGWRAAARRLLADGVPAEAVVWSSGGAEDLFCDAADGDAEAPSPPAPSFSVPRAFVELADAGLLHSDPGRFDLFYRLLVRVVADRSALGDAADPDLVRARALAKAVRRDKHKMTAFVRFREVGTEAGPRFVAWFEPDHHIVEATAPFFVRRFAAMRWSILTPGRSAHWDGQDLLFADGARRADAPDGDALEAVWRTYYASIFNPARLKVSAMRAEMPKKYWRNLPEAPLISPLIAGAARRTADMVAAEPPAPKKGQRLMSKPKPERLIDETAIDALRDEVDGCRNCPLWADATQAVFGEGPGDAEVVVVGEQPGDKEDIAGRPFVGPAGALFDRAAGEAGLDRSRVYVTNAVKHFKFEPRGKFRLHKTPAPSEIAACRPWLERELAVIRPKLVVAMGATAARAVVGKPVKIGDTRGRILESAEGPDVLVTVHPSFLLRLPDEARRREEFERFVGDLRLVAPFVKAA